jgi:tetratricopeptide (TPR) repeat protein
MLPELVVPNLWDAFSQLCEAQPGAAQIRSPVPWFGNLQLPGTAYDLPGRGQVTLDRLTSPAVFADLHRLAPWSATAAQLDFIAGAHRAPEKLEEVFGPVLELNLAAMRYRASLQEDDPAAYLPLVGRLCEVEPSDCLAYGYRLADAGSDAEAVKAYERAFAEADDRVLVANNMEWLINHLAENGRVDRALEIAQYVADVGSAAGLGARGRLLERLGRDDEALQLFRRMAARYERRQDELDEFLTAHRHRVADGRYEPEAAAAEARLFPQGLTRVRSSDFQGPPPDGVRVTGDSRRLRQMGLAPGAIVVALDGYRVHTLPQYKCVRRFTYHPRMALIVYFQGRYLELKPKLPQRSFDAKLESYPSDARRR